MVAQNDPESNTGAITIPQPSADDYRNITSFADALAFVKAGGKELVTAADLGDGFSVVDQSTVVGAPMVCLYAQLRTGDIGGYVVARCVTQDGRKVVIVDGGNGLYDQLKTYMEANGGRWPEIWPHGLRVSKYRKDLIDQKTGAVIPDVPCETYYLDTAA